MVFSDLAQASAPTVAQYVSHDPVKVAKFFGVSLRTAQRYLTIRDIRRLPGPAQKLLRIAGAGWLPLLDGWDGFLIVRGKLVSKDGHEVTARQVLGALHAMEFPTDKNIRRWLGGRSGFYYSKQAVERFYTA